MVMSGRAPALEPAPAAEHKTWTAAAVNWNGFTFQAPPHRPTAKGRGKRIKRGEIPTCQVDGCNANLMVMKEYHQRYRICEYHLRVNSVIKDEQPQRFCQQCGRFHVLDMFDREKRSCRLKLERHNARRRKPNGTAAAGPAAPEGPHPHPEPQPAAGPTLHVHGGRPGAAALPAAPGSPAVEGGVVAPLQHQRPPQEAGDGGASAMSNASIDTSRKRSRSSGSGSPQHRLARSVSLEEVDMLLDAGGAPPRLMLPDACSMPKQPCGAPGALACLSGVHALLAPAGLGGGGGGGLLPPDDAVGCGACMPDSPDAWSPFQQPAPLPFPGGIAGLRDASPLGHHAALAPACTLPASHALSHLRGESQLTLDTATCEAQASSGGPLPTGFAFGGGGGASGSPGQAGPSGLPAPHLASVGGSGGSGGGPLAVKVEEDAALDDLDSLGSAGGGGSADADAAAAGLDLLQFADLRTMPHTYHLHDALHPPPAASLAAPVPDALLRGFLEPQLPQYPAAALGPPLHAPLPLAGCGAPVGAVTSSLEYANALLAGNALPTLYQSFEQLVSLSLKMYQCMPSELPPQLREQLLDAVTDGLLPEGYIRAGCVHLTVDLFVPHASPLPPARAIAQSLLCCPDDFWRCRRVLVQQGATQVRLEGGKLQDGAEPGHAGKGQQEWSGVPEVALLSPPCVVANSSVRCAASVRGVPASELQLLCRASGRYLQVVDVEVQEVAGGAGMPPSLRVAFTLPPLPSRTLLRVEVAHRHLVSQPQVLLAVGSPAIVQEVRQLASPTLSSIAGQVVADLARVLELEGTLQVLYNEAAADLAAYLEACPPDAPRRQYTPAEMGSIVVTARRLLGLCCEVGWVNTFGAVLPVAAIGCQCASQLVEAVAAASMRGLPLLHLAIMSRRPAMVAFLLDWGCCNSVKWSNQAAGPFGLTPLHLAALLPDCPVIAELLTDALPDGHRQWLEATTTDGLTPADYAATSGHSVPLAAPPLATHQQHATSCQQQAAASALDATTAATTAAATVLPLVAAGQAASTQDDTAAAGPSSSSSGSSDCGTSCNELAAAAAEASCVGVGSCKAQLHVHGEKAWQLPEPQVAREAAGAGGSGKGGCVAGDEVAGCEEVVEKAAYPAAAKSKKMGGAVHGAGNLPSRLLTCRQIVCMLVALNVFMSLFALLLGNRAQPAVL